MVFPRVLRALDDRQHRDQGGMFSFTIRWWMWQSSKGVLTFPFSTRETKTPFRHIYSGNLFLANLLHNWVLLQNCDETCGSCYLQVTLLQIPHGFFFPSYVRALVERAELGSRHQILSAICAPWAHGQGL